MANLLLKNINKIYPNNVQAVFDFNLEIKDKEFIVFVGPSGCGKSTTLRMVAGLEDITFGDLYINGELVNEVLPKDRDVAMVFQNYALFPHLTVYDNIAFGLKIHKQLHPIIEQTPELQALDDKIALLWKDMKRVNKFFKKHQNDDEKLLERSDLYSQFYLLCDQREKLVKQKVGHYALGIKLEKKNIARLKNDISGLNKKITKLEAELKLIADPSVLTAIEQEIKDSTKALDDLKKSLEGADPTNVAKIKKSIREQEDKIKDANDRAGQLRQSLTSGPSYIEVYKTAVSKKEAEIKKCEDKIAHLNQNEVPLFKIRKDNKREIELMVNRVADVLDLTRYLYRKPTALSGGQRQRVALGRAIVRNPKVFLMDEPLSNLDAKLRVAMRSEITKIHERVGATTIYVTHDQTEAMTMADRVVCMKAGYVQQIGTPDDLYNNPSNVFVAGFIGSPAMNFIHCTVKKDTVVFKGDPSIAIKLNKAQSATLKPYEGKEIILGVRPEDMFTENDATNKRLTNSLKTHCDVSELLGNEIIIYTTIGQDKISMKVDAINNIKEGDTVMMKLNQDKLYFFDAKTEKRIYEVAAAPEVKSVNKVKAKPTKKAKAKVIKPKAKKKTKNK